jgi:hypothetical protein
MTRKVIGTILLITLFFRCGTKKPEARNLTVNDSTKAEEVAGSKNHIDSAKSTDDFAYSDCIRGQAESVTKKSIYPNAIFKLNPDNHTGTETVDLENGERLIINNWGCEYFVLTFRFETERFKADTTNTIYWLNKSVILMNEIKEGIDSPFNLQKGIDLIPIYLSSLDGRSYVLGEEIVFKDGDIRDYLSLDKVQKISDKRFAIEISYAKGPL